MKHSWKIHDLISIFLSNNDYKNVVTVENISSCEEGKKMFAWSTIDARWRRDEDFTSDCDTWNKEHLLVDHLSIYAPKRTKYMITINVNKNW